VVRETRPAVAGTKRRGLRGLLAQSQKRDPVEGRKKHSQMSMVAHGARPARLEQAHTESYNGNRCNSSQNNSS
jgi:hypothetical protein